MHLTAMTKLMTLANSLHHGELKAATTATPTEWVTADMALFGHGLGRIVSRVCEDEANEPNTLALGDNVYWEELLAVTAIAAVRPDPHEAHRFTVALVSDGDDSSGHVFQFQATSDEARTEWIRSLLLAKQLAARQGSRNAFIRFESSDSEECDADSVSSDGVVDLLGRHGRLSPRAKPEKAKIGALTVVQVTVEAPDGKSLCASIPLTSSLRQSTPIYQIKLQALEELRKIGYDALNEPARESTAASHWLQDYLRHEADWFALLMPTASGVWFKDEQRPLNHYVRTDHKDPIIHLKLEPITAMPHPTIALSITSTKNRVSDLSQRNYTTYLIDVSFNDMTWQVPRRYKDFHRLHQSLTATHTQCMLPKLPPKHIFTPVEGEFVAKRRVQLEAYVRHLVDHPVLGSDVLVLSFLGVVSTSRDRDLSRNAKNVIHVTALHVGLDYGDVVLFSCRFGASVIQRKVTGAKYDHVGIVVPGASRHLLRILEATGEGIQVYSLKARLMAYAKEVSKTIVVRRLLVERTPETMTKMNEFVARVEGNPYSILGILQTRGESQRLNLASQDTTTTTTSSSSQATSPVPRRSPVLGTNPAQPITPTRRASTGMLLLASPTKKDSASQPQPSRRKYFCSSLAAAALKHLGWLDTKHTSSYFWPGSFEEDGDIEKYLAPGVAMEKETVVDCRVIEVGLATSTS